MMLEGKLAEKRQQGYLAGGPLCIYFNDGKRRNVSVAGDVGCFINIASDRMFDRCFSAMFGLKCN